MKSLLFPLNYIQECSFWLGLCYIVASLSIYDEYSNDVLDLPEGSCFPRFRISNNNILLNLRFHVLDFETMRVCMYNL